MIHEDKLPIFTFFLCILTINNYEEVKNDVDLKKIIYGRQLRCLMDCMIKSKEWLDIHFAENNYVCELHEKQTLHNNNVMHWESHYLIYLKMEEIRK